MDSAFDVAVIGLGAMGSAAAYHLSKRGQRVLGLEQFTSPHDRGSSTGETRIIREAYHENPLYVPFVRRAYDLWADLEKTSGMPLLRITGGLLMGATDSDVYAGARRSADEHGIPHELLDARALRERFPQFSVAKTTHAMVEPRMGWLSPERCIEAHLALARKHGATLTMETRLLEWRRLRSEFLLKTSAGDFRAKRLVFAAGAWTKALVEDIELPLRVERQVNYWLRPKDAAAFRPGRMPIFLWEFEPRRVLYGFPDLGGGVKVGLHHEGDYADPDTLQRTVDPEETQEMRELLRRLIPALDVAPVAARVCMYTNTPDSTFIIDRHPGQEGVFLVSACSGHGFKFASAVGEAVAQLVLEGKTTPDLRPFRLERWLDK